MKLYCNYSSQDWNRLCFAMLVYLVVFVAPILLYIEYVFLPLVLENNTWLEFWKQDQTLSRYLKFSWNATAPHTDMQFMTKINSQIIVGFGMALGPLVLSIIPLWRGVVHLPSLSEYIIRKSKFGPRMKLVIKRVKQ